MSDQLILEGIQPDSVEREYRSRDLGNLSDSDLLSAAIESIARPAVKEDSFSVHAPLELLARFILLERVDYSARELARQQIVGLVAWYTNRYQRMPIRAVNAGEPVTSPLDMALRAVRTQDGQIANDAASLIVEHSTVDDVLRGLSDEFTTRLDVSAHSHIFLRLLREFDLHYPKRGLPLVRNFLVYLTRTAPVRQSWPLAARDLTPRTPEASVLTCEEFITRMLNPPRTPRPAAGGIRAIVQAVEATTALSVIDMDDLRRDAAARTMAAMRAACRIGPMSMLAESADHAKYGWTHCLTLPEAIWGLDGVLAQQGVAAAAAVAFAIAYRSTIGARELTVGSVAGEPLSAEQDRAEAAYEFIDRLHQDEAAAVRGLVSGACVRSDCHLVKYTLSALAAAARDGDARELYLSSAASLLALWQREVPDSAVGSDLARRE
jgi:hypothetical protein